MADLKESSLRLTSTDPYNYQGVGDTLNVNPTIHNDTEELFDNVMNSLIFNRYPQTAFTGDFFGVTEHTKDICVAPSKKSHNYLMCSTDPSDAYSTTKDGPVVFDVMTNKPLHLFTRNPLYPYSSHLYGDSLRKAVTEHYAAAGYYSVVGTDSDGIVDFVDLKTGKEWTHTLPLQANDKIVDMDGWGPFLAICKYNGVNNTRYFQIFNAYTGDNVSAPIDQIEDGLNRMSDPLNFARKIVMNERYIAVTYSPSAVGNDGYYGGVNIYRWEYNHKTQLMDIQFWKHVSSLQTNNYGWGFNIVMRGSRLMVAMGGPDMTQEKVDIYDVSSDSRLSIPSPFLGGLTNAPDYFGYDMDCNDNMFVIGCPNHDYQSSKTTRYNIGGVMWGSYAMGREDPTGSYSGRTQISATSSLYRGSVAALVGDVLCIGDRLNVNGAGTLTGAITPIPIRTSAADIYIRKYLDR